MDILACDIWQRRFGEDPQLPEKIQHALSGDRRELKLQLALSSAKEHATAPERVTEDVVSRYVCLRCWNGDDSASGASMEGLPGDRGCSYCSIPPSRKNPFPGISSSGSLLGKYGAFPNEVPSCGSPEASCGTPEVPSCSMPFVVNLLLQLTLVVTNLSMPARLHPG